MEFDQQMYEEQPVAPPPRPWLWIGLSIFFAVCCACFALAALGEAAWIIMGGGSSADGGSSSSTSSVKPTIGAVRFCIEQPDANTACSPTVTKAATSTKTIYATFDYKGMPKGATYAYDWELNDELVTHKDKLRLPKDGNGVVVIRLDVFKAGDYRLTITPTSGEEKSGQLKVGQ